MRFAPVLCVLLFACSSKKDESSPPPSPKPERAATPVPERSVGDKVAELLPNLGPLPIPRELGEDPIFVLADGVRDKDPEAAPLSDDAALRAVLQRRAAGQQPPFGVDLYVQGDLPYATFARVHGMARELGFGRFLLGVRTDAGVRRLPLMPPAPGAAQLDVVVSMSRDRLRAAKGDAAPVIDLAATDYGTLASQLDKLVPPGDPPILTVRVDPDVPYESVVLVIAAVRPITPTVVLESTTP